MVRCPRSDGNGVGRWSRPAIVAAQEFGRVGRAADGRHIGNADVGQVCPEPENSVALAVPLTFSAPDSAVVPMARPVVQVEETPDSVPVRVGEPDSTTLPEPVDPVVQAMAVPLVAVQKSLVVSVPNVVEIAEADEPIAIQLVPSQKAIWWLFEL